ncbi:MAG: agmatine deiminase family protein [Sedimenticola sp.]|nr:agmatine deiminase family protein [Sedimenticola sp.]
MKQQYSLPAEWVAQSAVMLTWPHANTDWAEQLETVEQVYLTLTQQITRFQPLLIVCNSPQHQKTVAEKIAQYGISTARISFALAASNDTWARDHAPLTCIGNDGAQLLDFQFNGWGNKYPSELDNQISQTLFEAGTFDSTPHQTIPLILEGGAIETDGDGTLLATRSSVLTESRNPGLSQADIEAILSNALGFDRFLWLNHGHLTGDDTDGHIDTLARFADSETILYATATADDPDLPEMEAMAAELRQFRQRDGQPYKLVPLPAIPPITDESGERVPAGYANFLIINQAVLLPIYNITEDEAALRCLERCFPGREIIPIDCMPLIRQNGSLHCITMQFPEPVTIAR